MLRSINADELQAPIAESATKLHHPLEDIKNNSAIFQNWGQTIISKPAFTFYPKTNEDLSRIVKWAKSIGKNIRVSGYKHSWTKVFVEDNNILISLLDEEEAQRMPAIHKELDNAAPFQQIKLIGAPFYENGKRKHLCKIGAATTNEQFRNWAVTEFKTKGSFNSWVLPLNAILVENTFGGTNAMICHGAGINNPTLSDLVTEIEFINPKGELQTIGYSPSDRLEQQLEGRQLIKTAAGSFGQLGIVTQLTFKLDQMTHARMNPCKPRLALAVPPPENFIFPDYLPAEVMQGVTAKQLRKAKKDFYARCEDDYYSEWFWFSLHENCWVNSWKNDGDESLSQSYPSPLEVKIQEIEEYLAYLANESILKFLPEKWQTILLSDAAMLNLFSNEEVVVPLPEALHFRRGIHNMPVQDMEFEIPIPALPNGKPDWSIPQRAWWDAIVTVYEWLAKKNKVPMRLPLEMRIMGGSEITMAAQKGNKWGTCSIEVLTLAGSLIDANEWHSFMQAIVDKWSAYTDAEGKPLNIRPHWAKQWNGLTIQRKGEQRKEIMEYIQEVYGEAIGIFKQDLGRIAEKGGYSVSDFGMFSIPLLDQIFHGKKKESEQEEKMWQNTETFLNDKEEMTDKSTALVYQELITKAQCAYKKKEELLMEKLNTQPDQFKELKQFSSRDEEKKASPPSLTMHSWFAEGRSLAHARQTLLEEKMKENENIKQDCNQTCKIF